MIDKKPQQFDNNKTTINTNAWQKVSYSKKSPITSSATKSDVRTHPTTKANNIKLIASKLPSSTTTKTNAQTTLKSQNKQTATATAKQKENHSYNSNNCSSATKINASPCAASSVSVIRAIVGNAARRRQEIRQIKRAHRHLLTSGGKDRQQAGAATAPHKKKNSCATAEQQNQQNSRRKEKIHKSSQNFAKDAHSSGSSAKTQTTKQQQSQQKGKQHKKQFVAYADSDSVISSRWCSIEAQLELLDQLLHYGDEEQCYDSADHEYFWHKRGLAYDYVNDDAAEEQELNWSDDMSATHSDAEGGASPRSTTSGTTASLGSTPPSSLKRRGHQHHPRFAGTRRPPAVPNVQEILNALYRGDSAGVLSNLRGEDGAGEEHDAAGVLTPSDADTLSTLGDSYSQLDEPEDAVAAPELNITKSALNLPLLTDSVTNSSLGSNSPTPTDDSSMLDEGMANAQTQLTAAKKSSAKAKSKRNVNGDKPERSEKLSAADKAEKAEKRAEKAAKKAKRDAKAAKRASAYLVDSIIDDGSLLDEGIALNDDDDLQSSEWAQLRCTSEANEIVAERETRRNKGRCADYPGLAFGRSIFSSDTMMKFNIIRNELHNIMNTQLKRVINARTSAVGSV